MLITTCGHCHARFRVTPQQLNAKQGQVRCGRCREVFNGFESLERFPDDDTGARLLAARESQARAEAETVGGIETLPDEGWAEPDPARPPAEREATAPPSTPAPAMPAPAAPATAASAPAAPMSAPAASGPAAAPAHAQAAPASTPQPVEPPGPPSTPHGGARRRPEPELVLQEPPRKRPSRAWAFAAALLALVLLLELAFEYRGPVAQRYPALRPALETACGWLGCTVPWAREDGLLKLEESDLLEVPGRPGEIALGARIRNLASVAQEYPHLELTLTDISGQPAARRVLRPTDYFGRPLRAGEVLAAGAEFSIQLRLAVPRIRATGYELLLFYP